MIRRNGSQLVGESVRIVEVLSVIRGLGSDEEVVVIQDLVQRQNSVEVVVTSGKQMIDFVLKQKYDKSLIIKLKLFSLLQVQIR